MSNNKTFQTSDEAFGGEVCDYSQVLDWEGSKDKNVSFDNGRLANIHPYLISTGPA